MSSAGEIPTPIVPTAPESTRASQTTLEGSVYNIYSRTTFSNLLLRLTANTSACTLVFAVYKQKDPNSTTFRKACEGSFAATGAGAANISVAMTPAPMTLEPGRILILWGRSTAGSATVRTYAGENYETLNSLIHAGTFPVTFTTGLAASSPFPDTLDATAQTETVNNVAPVVRLI